MSVPKIILSVLALVAMAACSQQRVPPQVCGAPIAPGAPLVAQSDFDPADPVLAPVGAMGIDAEEIVPSMIDGLRQSLGPALRRADPEPLVIDVLSLSAGGQYGAFGAGFLSGWAQNPVTPRPSFDLVTGVSAGGMLAPVAFSGNRHDAALQLFRGLGQQDVATSRAISAVLGLSPSLLNPGPLEASLKSLLSAELIADIARQHRSGAQLLVMATNLDSTRATVFQLGELAAAKLPIERRRDCIAEVMLASAAIPGVFPPRNIDGALYADGGLRDQVFLRQVESARVLLARETARPIKVRATIVINGSLRPPTTALKNSIFGYGERSLFILSDEVLRDSILETVSFAEQNSNWSLRGVIADIDLAGPCPEGQIEGTFDACVTEALFDEGNRLGRRSPIDFMTSTELRALASAY